MKWSILGWVALGAGVLYYPSLRLYKYLAKRGEDKLKEGGKKVKALVPALKGRMHKPHHRAMQNGHDDLSL
jgi:hypothetical protein